MKSFCVDSIFFHIFFVFSELFLIFAVSFGKMDDDIEESY